MSEVSFLRPSDMSSLSVSEVSTVSPVQENVPHGAHQKGWWSFIYLRCLSISNNSIPSLFLKKPKVLNQSVIKYCENSSTSRGWADHLHVCVSPAGGCKL